MLKHSGTVQLRRCH